MAGKPGRSGGSNKLTVEEHVRRGTHRVDRHGPRPPVLALATVPKVSTLPAAPKGAEVPADVVEGLRGKGLRFVEQAWKDYLGWTVSSRVLLHEAGRLLDELETLRGQRAERATQRLLAGLLAQLHLED